MIKDGEVFQSARRQLVAEIATVSTGTFASVALRVFRFQAAYNPVYADYLRLIGKTPGSVSKVEEIPFLPIGLFKSHFVRTGEWEPEVVFTSSGTTGRDTSRHPVRDANWYLEGAAACFERHYGPLEEMGILALLPSYLEREGSSLIAMADHFIRRSKHPESGFFLDDFSALNRSIRSLREKGAPVLLLGVSFALWDFATFGPEQYRKMVVMETGGMKGRREEITREALHAILGRAFATNAIHSEYGMTEMLSQAYSRGAGRFEPCSRLRVLVREITDPFAFERPGKTGGINVIDLANVDSVSFIATDDLGRVYADGAFEVLGRLDNSDVRGCNLLVQ